MWYDFLFVDKETGEEFLVEEKTLKDAWKIVYKYFDNAKFIETLSVEEGEMLGLDTY